jgi:hypothetical protein
MKGWTLGISLPMNANVDLARDSMRRFTFAFGDPELRVGYQFRTGDWKWGTMLTWALPIGI